LLCYLISSAERIISGFTESFVMNLNEWKLFIFHEASTVGRSLPDDWDAQISDFQRILIVSNHHYQAVQ
jgi:hypothetical protein